ncbi:hypothetical protein SynBIOSU31_01078 [Synechococcus sp. BIOS-U3-1]|nr:hypothetical protein SynBIOSU31_01078 [Synechococcus sp. BIOS-U3-1]
MWKRSEGSGIGFLRRLVPDQAMFAAIAAIESLVICLYCQVTVQR